MPTFANSIVINDGEATPVAHTFAPERRDGSSASFVDRSSGISVGYPRIKFTHLLAEKGKPLNKVRVQITVPKLETISGSTSQGLTPAPRLAYACSFDGVLIYPDRATEQERKNLRTYLVNSLLHTAGIEATDKIVPFF